MSSSCSRANTAAWRPVACPWPSWLWRARACSSLSSGRFGSPGRRSQSRNSRNVVTNAGRTMAVGSARSGSSRPVLPVAPGLIVASCWKAHCASSRCVRMHSTSSQATNSIGDSDAPLRALTSRNSSGMNTLSDTVSLLRVVNMSSSNTVSSPCGVPRFMARKVRSMAATRLGGMAGRSVGAVDRSTGLPSGGPVFARMEWFARRRLMARRTMPRCIAEDSGGWTPRLRAARASSIALRHCLLAP
mmetsp:Transcript_19959/g.76550  ORF Transcript_19959/g.76550 Transcript_19959/m.76550 type:complete len:245 (-) Transcript_19959:85-819(-)